MQRTILLSILAIVLLSAAPVVAQEQEPSTRGGIYSEFYVGTYKTEDVSGNDLSDRVFGIRAGTGFYNGLGWEGSIGVFETRVVPIGYEFRFIDLSAVYRFNPEDPVVVVLFSGIGNTDRTISGRDFEESDSYLSVHGGIALKGYVADHVYFRPDVRVRWFEDCRNDCSGWEYSLAIGFDF
jgi:hypothetical protein